MSKRRGSLIRNNFHKRANVEQKKAVESANEILYGAQKEAIFEQGEDVLTSAFAALLSTAMDELSAAMDEDPASTNSNGELATNSDEYKMINPEMGVSQKTFNVSYSFDREEGLRKISVVRVNGRPPTGYSKPKKDKEGKDKEGERDFSSEGPHTVAHIVIATAIINSMKGKSFEIGTQNQETGDTITSSLQKILEGGWAEESLEAERNDGNPPVTKESIGKKLELLELRQQAVFNREDYTNDTDYRNRVRKHSNVMRTDLNIVTENIIRLWANRKYAVHYHELEKYIRREKKSGGSGEGTTMTDLELRLKGESNRENNNKTPITLEIPQLIINLIDLKTTRETANIEKETFPIKYYDKDEEKNKVKEITDIKGMQKIYDNFTISAVKETFRLLNIAFPVYKDKLQNAEKEVKEQFGISS